LRQIWKRRESNPLFLNGHRTEFGPEAANPIDDALAGLLEFYATGTRPTLNWVGV
jgi:hypothetical protein